jgi:hypothetical protein
MTNDERIIKYLENDLSSDERIGFESDLKNSSELREEYEKYLKANHRVNELKDIKLKQAYLDSFILEFRNSINTQKPVTSKRNLGYAFGAIIAMIISIAIFNNIMLENKDLSSVEEFTESLNQDQKFELLQSLNGSTEEYDLISENLDDAELTSLIQSELNINNEIAEVYDIGYNELVEELSKNEADKIYQEILNKNFSQEVNL